MAREWFIRREIEQLLGQVWTAGTDWEKAKGQIGKYVKGLS